MIEVSGLTHVYPGRREPAVENLTFQVDEGEVFGFLGPSGAGKSTTLTILFGLLDGWRGDVVVGGRPLGQWGADYYRRIGVSFESPNHYLKLTARENLDYFRALHGVTEATAEKVLAEVGLEDHIDRPVETFSKGMKMRLNFARSLLNEPEIWFLDEPTTGLDPVNAVRIRKLIRERQEVGTTTVVATHDMNTAEAVCDRVAFIVDGRVAVIDSPSTLRQRFGRRAVELRWVDDDGSEGSESFSMDGLAEDGRFLELLGSAGLSSIHSQEASLEDAYVFGASLVLLEKTQGTLYALRTAPLTARAYIASKVLTLTTFALVESGIIYAIAFWGVPVDPLPVVLGVVSLGAVYTLVGLGQVAPHDSVTSFLMPGALTVGGLLQLPFLFVLGVGPAGLWYAVPTQGPLLLMLAGFDPLELWQWVYAVAVAVGALLTSGWWARRRFSTYIGLQEV